MAFDMGWAFAPTYGTPDSHYGVRALTTDTYPHTFTNGDGQSINAGWVSGPTATVDKASGNDWRIVGIAYTNPSTSAEFKVDLSSGSAPGAGSYSVDIALGDAVDDGVYARVAVQDNGSTILDLTNGTAGYAIVGAGHFRDATATDVTATTTWTGTPVSKSWSTTTVNVLHNPSGALAQYCVLAHFRLTLQAAPAAYTLALAHAQLTLTGQAVATRTARLLAVQHASLAMTGQVAALRAERQLALDAAALTLTGQAAALQAERTLPLDAAQLTLTGQAAALQAERQLPLDAANLTLTGQAAELQRGYTLGLDAAQLTLTGQAMTLQRTAQLLLDRGLLALHGQAVTLRKQVPGGGAGQMMRRHHHDRG